MFQANNYQPGEIVAILAPIQNQYGTWTPPHHFEVVRAEEGQPGQGLIYLLSDTQTKTQLYVSADKLVRVRH